MAHHVLPFPGARRLHWPPLVSCARPSARRPEGTTGLRVRQVGYERAVLTLLVAAPAPTAAGPVYHCESIHVHSLYQHTLLDLPVGAHPVCLPLQMRRFFCHVADCPGRLFAERAPEVTRPYVHRTSRLTTAWRAIGLALGGKARARLAANLHLSSSADTLLRLVRQTPELSLPQASPMIGIDDRTMRNGQTYRTSICDRQTGAVVDWLPDREAATVATGLQQHPGVEIISCDRGGAYAEGARLSDPLARQVTNRLHVLCNLGQALKEGIARLYP